MPGVKVVPRTASLNDAILLAGGQNLLRDLFNLSIILMVHLKRTFRYKENSPRGSRTNPILRSEM